MMIFVISVPVRRGTSTKIAIVQQRNNCKVLKVIILKNIIHSIHSFT